MAVHQANKFANTIVKYDSARGLFVTLQAKTLLPYIVNWLR